MEKNITRPQRIAPDQVDSAVEEALLRVEQAHQLSAEDLSQANGGIVPTRPVGFLPTE